MVKRGLMSCLLQGLSEKDRVGELPAQLEIEGRIDCFLLLLSLPNEFNLWNNGGTVGIMWQVAHAAVTSAV